MVSMAVRNDDAIYHLTMQYSLLYLYLILVQLLRENACIRMLFILKNNELDVSFHYFLHRLLFVIIFLHIFHNFFIVFFVFFNFFSDLPSETHFFFAFFFRSSF